MPFNKLKIYNQFLELVGLSEKQQTDSLKAIFKRDFEERLLVFNSKNVHPTPKEDGEIPMDTLFRHLTTEMIDKISRARVFELNRSMRLHWIKYLLEHNNNMLLFSVKEPEGYRTYYYDKEEKYVIIFEPLRNGVAYYLLTAYYVRGKDAQRNKIEKKYRRKLDDIFWTNCKM